eukprot:SAG11_NODE_9731_length_885_cov_0.846056_1_plen_108_part_00
MCEEMGWQKSDVEQSLELMQSDGDGRVSLVHYLQVRMPQLEGSDGERSAVFCDDFLQLFCESKYQWYSDDGLLRNVMASFDIDRDGQLSFKEFGALCHAISPHLQVH